MINQIQNAQLLKHLKEVVSDLIAHSEGFKLTDEHKEVLDERLRRQAEEGEWYSWEEVIGRVRDRE